ncbi:hypothetical protein HNQ60_001620 [Povalibacter uvarum]|uniref:DUF4153 domain-containing protein n=1 Tax=Povalibacter uvarum TaxID=732238 RepID=A0A841HKU5_9GAMM|nr:DUF4153 domain-containing protein [Povalibacter uvarum]MBB6092742.1 hypothetical protein [Povalibacter uvarum]
MTGQSTWKNLLRGSAELPVILIAATLQGWSLYFLHICIDDGRWPATNLAALSALYAAAIFAPLTVQLLVQHARQRLAWMAIAVVAVFSFFAAWHFGGSVMLEGDPRHPRVDEWASLAFVLGVLWLLAMPFLQARLLDGRWRPRYERLFATAWNNKFLLAEAVAFTALFWLLLVLWAQLFRMLGMQFFKELFEEPIFFYPVTSIVFGVALHLIGSLERLTSVLLEQVLSVLKWLALVAGLILTLFTVALITKLPTMIGSGERAIAASWLLWLVAVTVLLVNAAYRDGSVSTPYPRRIAATLRFVIPLTIVIALTALYALWLRIDEYGFTVSRFWACVVAGAALLYSVGYGLACRDGQRWLSGIASVNIVTALYLIAVIALALTPALSPHRIAANSQFKLALAAKVPGENVYVRSTPLEYLRFNAGAYGLQRLREISRIENHPQAQTLRKRATALLERKNRWDAQFANTDVHLAGMVREPAGRAIDAELLATLETDLANPANGWRFGDTQTKVAGFFVDMNDDGIAEFVLVRGQLAWIYGQVEGRWTKVNVLMAYRLDGANEAADRVEAGDFKAQAPAWRDLVVGGRRYRSTTDQD